MRAAIHTGEVEVKDADHTPEDISGTEVDFAARVISKIEGAEIWVSDAARGAILRPINEAERARLAWSEHNHIVFKGFEDEPPVTLWSLTTLIAHAAADPRGPAPRTVPLPPRPLPAGRAAEPAEEPFDIRSTDFVSGYEVWIDPPNSGRRRTVSGQIHLHRQMYFETEQGARILFGFKRLFLETSTSKSGPGEVRVPDEVLRGATYPRAVRVNPDDGPGRKVTLCISGERGAALGSHSVPRIGDDNFLAEFAVLSEAVSADRVGVALSVPLNPEGIVLDRTIEPLVSRENREDIAAIAAILVSKGHARDKAGRIKRKLKVRIRGDDD